MLHTIPYMGDFEGAIDDPSWHERAPSGPTFGVSEGRASVQYPDGKVFWFARNGKYVVFDKAKSHDSSGKPIKNKDILKARNAVIDFLTSQN
jgi:hypothetical protein